MSDCRMRISLFIGWLFWGTKNTHSFLQRHSDDMIFILRSWRGNEERQVGRKGPIRE